MSGDPEKPVFILPFMFGHSQSSCVRRMVTALKAENFDVYVILQRGCGVDELDQNSPLVNEYLDTGDIEAL